MKDESSVGSGMSTKQLAYSVLHGKKVTATCTTGQTESGYLAGMDDYHWFVLVPDGSNVRQVLVHKTAPHVEISTAPTYDDEDGDLLRVMEPIIRPFRDKLSERYQQRPVRGLPPDERSKAS